MSRKVVCLQNLFVFLGHYNIQIWKSFDGDKSCLP